MTPRCAARPRCPRARPSPRRSPTPPAPSSRTSPSVSATRGNYFLLLGRLRDRVPPVFGEVPAGACPLFYPLLCEDKAAVAARLLARGIETVDFWREGHPLCAAGEFPEVASLRRRVLELPVHQDLGP